MASAKVSNSLSGSDAEDGNDSDEDGGFVMTRTAGKRRLNVSAADMVANEILDDVNEDLIMDDDETTDPIKRLHRGYMNEAVAMAQLALRTNETPVGCVLVHNGRVIARGMNATNMTRNGTRHAELMCINALLSYWDDVNKADEPSADNDDYSDCGSAEDYDDEKKDYTEEDWQKVDPSKGHLFPYGQKLHPARIVNPDIIHECSLYVTVEPCIMCASLLRQYGIKKVYFGAANDKFGGTGGVLRIHMNSKPNEPVQQNVTYIETYVTNMMSRPKRPSRPSRPPISVDTAETGAASAEVHMSDAASTPSPTDSAAGQEVTEGASMTTTITRTVMTTDNTNNPPVIRHSSTIPIAEGAVPARDEGHGGNVEPGFDVEGGWGRDKAVFLLRQFYVQENGRAPAPRKKEGRAQRLVEQMKCETESTIKLPSTLEQLPFDGPPAVAADAQVSLPSAALNPAVAIPMATETIVETVTTITAPAAANVPPVANITNVSND
ncbi:tRNA(adenine34) deaminase [Sporothrix bragantina]|uniref:tRNA(Adenine34) deaminase n=1 Tax=Sporothrix bragantina TaxID=671064 RepID=A0ABP0BTQ2_9PEZI